jgi:hypothetical protein
MNYYGAKELADSLRTVRKNTLIISEEIPVEHYGFRAAPETRTIAQLLTHIAVAQRMPEQIHSIERRTTLEGFDFPEFMRGIVAEEQRPRSKAQIIALLRDEGERWAKWLEDQSDDFLAERVKFPAGMTPPPRPVDADRADAGHRAAPDSEHAGAHGSRVERSGPLGDITVSPPADSSIERRREYLQWSEKVMGWCRHVNAKLDQAFDQAIARARELLRLDP